MIEQFLVKYLPIPIHILEIMGIVILIIAAAKAFYYYLKGVISKDYYPVKHEFANSMAMALEFKLAAEILKTVIVHDIQELILLGAIILLRAFMAFLIHWEMKSADAMKSNDDNTNSLLPKRSR